MTTLGEANASHAPMEEVKAIASGNDGSTKKPAVQPEKIEHPLLIKNGIKNSEECLGKPFNMKYRRRYSILPETFAVGPTDYTITVLAFIMRNCYQHMLTPFDLVPETHLVPEILADLLGKYRKELTEEVNKFFSNLYNESKEFREYPLLTLFPVTNHTRTKSEKDNTPPETIKMEQVPLAVSLIRYALNMAKALCDSIYGKFFMIYQQRMSSGEVDYEICLDELYTFYTEWENYFNSCMALSNLLIRAQDIVNQGLIAVFKDKEDKLKGSKTLLLWSELSLLFSSHSFHGLHTNMAAIFITAIKDIMEKIIIRMAKKLMTSKDLAHALTLAYSQKFGIIWNTFVDMHVSIGNLKELNRSNCDVYTAGTLKAIIDELIVSVPEKLKELTESAYSTLHPDKMVLKNLQILSIYSDCLGHWIPSSVALGTIRKGLISIKRSIIKEAVKERANMGAMYDGEEPNLEQMMESINNSEAHPHKEICHKLFALDEEECKALKLIEDSQRLADYNLDTYWKYYEKLL